jgi:hypothetical protein
MISKMKIIKLKRLNKNTYALFGPNGNRLSPIYRGTKDNVIEWARIYCSSWYEWQLDYSEIDGK